jgi:putative transposase
MLGWAMECKIKLRHIQPGKPTQNAHVESFHGRLREECLRISWFRNLFDARIRITAWKKEYNEERPHSSLGYRTPAEFVEAIRCQSYEKDAGFACLETPPAFPTLPQLRRRVKFVSTNVRSLGAGQSDRLNFDYS